jgi:serine/threonine protein kinase
LFDIAHKDVKDLIHKRLFFKERYEMSEEMPIHLSETAAVVSCVQHLRADYETIYQEIIKPSTDQGLETVVENALKVVHKQIPGITVPSSVGNGKSLRDLCITFDTNRNSIIDKREWLEFCAKTFGSERKVVIKFMENKAQYEREINTRKESGLDENYVLPILSHYSLEDDTEDRSSLNITLPNNRMLSDYRYCLILPFADRNLHTIYTSERPDIAHVKVLMMEIGLALKHCHDQRLIHGDLKMLNIVRANNVMKLIDLDASAQFDEFCGSKFSSGVLPPEMFKELNPSQRAEYCEVVFHPGY